MLHILSSERRGSGNAYASLVTIEAWGDRFTLVLQRHPVIDTRRPLRTPWQSGFYQTPADGRLTEPLWRSHCREAATQAIDELLEHIAHLGLPDDLYPLVTALLPEVAIGQPLYDPNPAPLAV